MDRLSIFITLLATVAIYLCLRYTTNETFLADIKKINKIGSADHSILDDKLFSDVKEFHNDDDGRLGIDKCLEQCKGNCLEYGQTGTAYCFPANNAIKANYNTTMRNIDNETDDVDRATEKLTYPGLR